MTDRAKQLLLEISQHPSRENGIKLKFPDEIPLRQELSLAYKELLQLGYVEETDSAIGSKYFVITAAGIFAAKN